VILGGILIASFCWALTFGLSLGNFWLKIGLSVAIVSIYSLFFQKPQISFQIGSIFWGMISAALLYLLFLMADKILPQVLFGAKSQVEHIYRLGAGTSKILIFLLLLLITGPGEEIFWRGFIQRHLMEQFGPFAGMALTSFIYSGVHLFSGNLVLILAALVAGSFWGLLYLWKKDLLAQIASHSLWGATIFVVAPIE